MAIVRPASGKPKTLPPIHPSAALEIAYQRKLEALVEEMHRSLVYWLTATYRANQPEMAQDAPGPGEGTINPYYGKSPAIALRDMMRRLGRRWTKRFNKVAPELAKYFATAAADRVDGTMAAILKKHGWTVKFKMTDEANDVLQATTTANVALIKSLASEHLAQVEGAVMRSVQAGRDLGSLAKDLDARYGITRRRAALIAKSQNNLATATITKCRQTEVGITEALWLHSGGGKHPRPDHVAANGKKYEIAKGMELDDGWVLPGQLINCRCVSRSIIPGLGPR